MRTKAFNHDEIVDAAMQVFWQLGYSATSIQDLVDATGLSRSSLYNAFENKHGLYAQALRRYHELTARNITLLQEPGPVKELVRRLLMRIVNDELDGSAQRGCLAANAALELAGPDDSITELLAGNFLRLKRPWSRRCCAARPKGKSPRRKTPGIGTVYRQHHSRPTGLEQRQRPAPTPATLAGCARHHAGRLVTPT